jgi:MipA family protein
MDFAQLIPSQRMKGDMTLSLGATAISAPEYIGADENRIIALPLVDAQWRNGLFASTRSGLGFNFSRDPRFDVGVRMLADAGRKAKRSPRLRGFDDVDPSPMLGVFANWRLADGLLLQSSIQSGAGKESSAGTVNVGLAYGMRVAPRLQAGISAALTYATKDYMQVFHGVNAQQRANSISLGIYSPEGGLHSARLSVNAVYSFDERWSAGLVANSMRLLGDAANSPLTEKRGQFTALVFASYRLF